MVKKAKTKESVNSSKDIENRVVELAKKGFTSEKIGLELKKQGIFVKKDSKKRINDILKEQSIEKDPDITNLEKGVEKLKKHLSKNKHDYPTKRALLIKEAKLYKLKKIKE